MTTEHPPTRWCTQCGARLQATRYCTICGAEIGTAAPVPPAHEPTTSRRVWPFVVAGAAVALVGVIVAVVVVGSGGANDRTETTTNVDARRSSRATVSTAAAPTRNAPTTRPAPVAPTTPSSAPPLATTVPRVASATAAPGLQSPDLPALLTSFGTYVDGINSKSFSAAYALFTRAQQQRIPYSDFASGATTSRISAFVVHSVTPSGLGTALVRATFTSEQAPEYGPNRQTCSRWDMNYTMVKESDQVWRIDGSTPINGTPLAC
jgi:hypothetical protein